MAHTDALNTIAIFSENFRSIVQNAESRSMNPVKTLEIDRNEFVKWTELAESTRIKLIKTEDSSMNEENLKGKLKMNHLKTYSLIILVIYQSYRKHLLLLQNFQKPTRISLTF